MVELRLGDCSGLLTTGNSEVRGGVGSQRDLHLDRNFGHILLGLLHSGESAPQDLVEVAAQGVEGVTLQRQGQIVFLAHIRFLLVLVLCFLFDTLFQPGFQGFSAMRSFAHHRCPAITMNAF